MSRKRRQTGFTLVELVTSIVIIGILAAAIEPKFIGNQTFSERGYADEVAAALRYAQAVAVANGCGAAVTITAISYQALQPGNAQPTCGGGWTRTIVRVDGGTLTGTAPSGVTFNQATQIIFGPQGRIVSGVPQAPQPLLSDGGFTLNIDPVSGWVTVQ